MMSAVNILPPVEGCTFSQCSPASIDRYSEPPEPPTQISAPSAAKARKTELPATGIVAQVLPASSERCSVPSEDKVQRGTILPRVVSSAFFVEGACAK